MKLYDLPKALEISEALVYEYYPNVACAVLTGSQTEEDFVSLVSDIDILIIDYGLSGVSSEGLIHENYKVDFTRIGLWNLVDILIESCYSKNNTIMNMIIQGHFICDTLNLQNGLKAYCQSLYRNSDVNYFSEYQRIRRALIMLKKHFSKDLRNEQILLTLSDFMLEISKAYLFFNYNGKYGLNGYRRSKLLYKTEKDFAFLQHINKLAEGYFIKKNSKNIIFQIDQFLGYSLLNAKKMQDFRYVLNIQFSRQNSFIFFTEILARIKRDIYLSKYFLYGKRVGTNTIFNYEYVLLFENKNGTLDASILECFNIVISDIKKSKRLKHINVDAFYLKETWFDLTCYFTFEPIFGAINEILIALLKEDHKFNYKKTIPIFIYIILKCMQTWNLPSVRIIQALEILRDKHRMIDYYRDVSHQNIETNNRIIKDLDDAFQKENALIIQDYKLHIKNKTFFNAISEGFPLFESLNYCLDGVTTEKLRIYNVPEYVRNIYQLEDPDISYSLVTFFDFSLKAMGLNVNQYSPAILFALSVIRDAD